MGGGKMEKRAYRVLLTAVLATILAVPSIFAANIPERIQENFLLGETGCQMNVFMEQDGSGITDANVGPAGRPSPNCRYDASRLPDNPWVCPPSPCCIWDTNGEFGGWICSYDPENEGQFLCASCTTWNGEVWVTPNPCPPVPGPGGTPLPTCNLTEVDFSPISESVICDVCTKNSGDEFYTCAPATCLPFTAVERNIMEKHGDNSKWCYSSGGYSVCAR
jgi:hypothetical protein